MPFKDLERQRISAGIHGRTTSCAWCAGEESARQHHGSRAVEDARREPLVVVSDVSLASCRAGALAASRAGEWVRSSNHRGRFLGAVGRRGAICQSRMNLFELLSIYAGVDRRGAFLVIGSFPPPTLGECRDWAWTALRAV